MMIKAEQLLTDRSGRSYELTVGRQAPSYVNGDYCRFADQAQAKQLITELNYSLSQWLRVIYLARIPITQSVSSRHVVMDKIADLAVEKKIAFYALPSVKHALAYPIKGGGWCYCCIRGPMEPPLQGVEEFQPIYGRIDAEEVIDNLRDGSIAVLCLLRDFGLAKRLRERDKDEARERLMTALLDKEILAYKLPYNPTPRRSLQGS